MIVNMKKRTLVSLILHRVYDVENQNSSDNSDIAKDKAVRETSGEIKPELLLV